MRTMTIPALAAFLALAACSSGEKAATDDEGALDIEEVAARAADAPKLQPGLYETKATLIDFDMPSMPGMPAGQNARMKEMLTGSFAKPSTFCMSSEEAAEGPREMIKQMQKSDCTVAKYDVSATGVNAEMQCKGPDGSSSTVKVDGTVSGNSSSVTMESNQQMPGMPGAGVHMKMRMDSRRIGECAG